MTVTAEQIGYRRSDGIWVFTRQEFGARRFDYRSGEHVVFGGPTQQGKTTLAFGLLEYVATPERPAYVAVSKPRDRVSEREGRRLGFRRVSEWPPVKHVKEYFEKPRGYLVWPQFGNIDEDVERCAIVTARLLGDRYTAGARSKSEQAGILVMDDTMVKAKIMGLDRQMVTILAMAGAMDLGLWVFIQKPTDSGRTALWSFENTTHLFMTKGGDARMLKRYLEIAGEHGPDVKRIVPTLKPFEFLYLHKYEGYLCIVGAK